MGRFQKTLLTALTIVISIPSVATGMTDRQYKTKQLPQSQIQPLMSHCYRSLKADPNLAEMIGKRWAQAMVREVTRGSYPGLAPSHWRGQLTFYLKGMNAWNRLTGVEEGSGAAWCNYGHLAWIEHNHPSSAASRGFLNALSPSLRALFQSKPWGKSFGES